MRNQNQRFGRSDDLDTTAYPIDRFGRASPAPARREAVSRGRLDERDPAMATANEALAQIDRMQTSLDELNELADDLLQPIRFPIELTMDDGPRAA